MTDDLVRLLLAPVELILWELDRLRRRVVAEQEAREGRRRALQALVERWHRDHPTAGAETGLHVELVHDRIVASVGVPRRLAARPRVEGEPSRRDRTGLRKAFDARYRCEGEERVLLAARVRDRLELRRMTLAREQLTSGGDVVSAAALDAVVADLLAVKHALMRPLEDQLLEVITSDDDLEGRVAALDLLRRRCPEAVHRLEVASLPPELRVGVHAHRAEWDALVELLRGRLTDEGRGAVVRELTRAVDPDLVLRALPTVLAFGDAAVHEQVLAALEERGRVDAIPVLREAVRAGALPAEQAERTIAGIQTRGGGRVGDLFLVEDAAGTLSEATGAGGGLAEHAGPRVGPPTTPD